MIGQPGAFRAVTAGLLVVFGFIIVGRGLLEAAPIAFIAMGAGMAVLGLYRLRLLARPPSGQR